MKNDLIELEVKLNRCDLVIKHSNGAIGKVIKKVSKDEVDIMWTFSKTPSVVSVEDIIKL